jgi:hypothetical protein
VLPGEDADAAAVLEDVPGAEVESPDGLGRPDAHPTVTSPTAGRLTVPTASRRVSKANTAGLRAETAGVDTPDERVRGGRPGPRTSARVWPPPLALGARLNSVAAMQGRIAMWHFLGDAVSPLDLKQVSSNVFTSPEIATVGWSQQAVDNGEIEVNAVTLPLAGNARAKMQGVHDGFVKLFCRPVTGIVVGGVVVAPRASELIHPVAIAVAESRLPTSSTPSPSPRWRRWPRRPASRLDAELHVRRRATIAPCAPTSSTRAALVGIRRHRVHGAPPRQPRPRCTQGRDCRDPRPGKNTRPRMSSRRSGCIAAPQPAPQVFYYPHTRGHVGFGRGFITENIAGPTTVARPACGYATAKDDRRTPDPRPRLPRRAVADVRG